MVRMRSALLIGLLALAACDNGCDNNDLDRAAAKSPDGRRRAVKFVRTCHSASTTQVNVQGRWGLEHIGPGNAFSSDAGYEDVRVWWVANDRLHISYPGKAKVFLRAARVDTVSIEYAPR